MKPLRIDIDSIRDKLELGRTRDYLCIIFIGSKHIHILRDEHTMTQMILKLKQDQRLCKFCNILEGIFLALFPIALPFLIMAGAMQY